MDTTLFHILNGSHSLFIDGVMVVLTSGYTWIPLYIALFYLVVKNNESVAQIMLVVGCSALCVLVTAGVADLLVKPLVGRPRPSLDPLLKYSVDVVGGMRGSGGGFFSAHAANTFGIALFLSLVVRSRLFASVMVLWSLLNCYTRVYLGLHYPSDILAGLLFGAMAGALTYVLYVRLYLRISPRLNYISSKYTSTGYSHTDIDAVVAVMAFTMIYVVLRAVITQ